MESNKEYVRALEDALVIHEAGRAGVKLAKGAQVQHLGGYGIFTNHELARIVDTSPGVVTRALERAGLLHVIGSKHLQTNYISAVHLLAKQYHEGKSMSGSLLDLIMEDPWDMDLPSLERLTGIPNNILMEVRRGGTYISGVLRPRVNTKSF